MKGTARLTRRQMLATSALGLAGTLIDRGHAKQGPRGWVRDPQRPVLSLGPAGAFDHWNIFAPCVVKVKGRYYMFYSGGPQGDPDLAPDTEGSGRQYVNYQLGLALSDDGVHFHKTGGPIFPLTERANFHAAPALLRKPNTELHKENGLWHLVFNGNRRNDVEHATSPDGLTWALDARNPIYRDAYAPCLLKVGGEYRMYHVDGSQRPWRIFLATGPDLYSLSPHPANPMLELDQHNWEAQWEPGPDGVRSPAALVYPYVWKEDKTWIMYYAAYWKSGWGVLTTAMGMATSPDGIVWKKNPDNPVFTPVRDSSYDRAYVSSQTILRDRGGYVMYYAARIDTVHKYFCIARATWQGKMLRTPSPSGRGLG
ncbi:hypothetical protein HS125_01025 [bacterium]|nr:hypothetical protein [bacterium]